MFKELVLPVRNRAVSHGGESLALSIFEAKSEGVESRSTTFSIYVGWSLRDVTVRTFFCVIFGGAR